MQSDKYSLLNDRQKEAVFTTEGPVLILAGAGSGKTRALTHRIAYLIEEQGVPPYNILAITFTNKAAQEMKERVQSLVEYSDAVWVSTFHAMCVRILRRHIDALGYEPGFSIYDTEDQKTTMRHVIKDDLKLDPKQFREREMLSFISSMKNELQTPEDIRLTANGNYRTMKQADIFEAYQERLKKNNALDFDDLLVLTVQLFRECPDILRYYQDRFQYIMVDEYQDTNHVQFELVYLLAGPRKNLCVVGDDDQSIYRFRGADIRNILGFEQKFPGAKVIKLEQNYRSTTSILDCANAVIRHNDGRKEKHLWSENGTGVKVHFREYGSAYEEAEEVVRKIRRKVQEGASYQDFAILYRTNAQSRTFEEKCISLNVPYRMVGGVNFYQRAEIKDILSYLKTIAMGRDDLSVQRIVNQPRRGIGDTTIDKLLIYAGHHNLSLLEAIRVSAEVPGVERARTKLAAFYHLIGELRDFSLDQPMDEIIREVIDRTDYLTVFDDLDPDQAEQKQENLDELIAKAHDFEMNWEGDENPTLTDFLEEVALVADIDSMNADEDRILLMTLHASKGLEFPYVFLCGMEDGLFPSYMSLDSGDPYAVEEERRLCYVGITRAMRELTLTAARTRTIRGDIQYNKVSRFVKEIPRALLDSDDLTPQEKSKSTFSFGGYNGESGSFSSSSGRYGNEAHNGLSFGKSFSMYQKEGNESARPEKKPSFGKTFEVKPMSSLDYTVGDRVEHTKFGEGTVTDITKGPKDFEVTVSFDHGGDKRMMAGFAKLKKL